MNLIFRICCWRDKTRMVSTLMIFYEISRPSYDSQETGGLQL